MDKQTADVEEMIISVIHEIGVPADLRGYRYLIEAITIVLDNADAIYRRTQAIYAPIAEKHATTAKQVSQSITWAILVAWDRGDLDTLQRYFGYTVSNYVGHPTNSEFIALVAETIRLRLKKLNAR